MNPFDDLVRRYIAVWNESDRSRRRERIASLWAPDGASLHRLLEPRGHAALEARVTTSHEKWNQGRGYTFRLSGAAQAHHDIAMIGWQMWDPGNDRAVSHGLTFLLLADDRRVLTELQFAEPPAGPPTPQQQALVDRYVEAWNVADDGHRRDAVAALWAADGAHVNPQTEHRGHPAIEREARRVYGMCGAQGQRFRCAGRVDGHHDAIRMDWELLAADGHRVLAAGTNLLLHDSQGRLRSDLQFDAPAPQAG